MKIPAQAASIAKGELMRGAYLLCLPLLAILGGCTPTPAPTPPPVTSGCPGGNTGPSVRYGSLNLAPTVGVVTTALVVSQTLIVGGPPPKLQLGFGGPVIGDAYEICVVTNPPARRTHLGVDVTGVLEDPSPSGGASGPVNFWQNVFFTYFVGPLRDNQTDANGVLKLDVSAQNLLGAIINAPPGNRSGRELITIILSDGSHKLDLTLTPP